MRLNLIPLGGFNHLRLRSDNLRLRLRMCTPMEYRLITGEVCFLEAESPAQVPNPCRLIQSYREIWIILGDEFDGRLCLRICTTVRL
jgi:hypothetical protein